MSGEEEGTNKWKENEEKIRALLVLAWRLDFQYREQWEIENKKTTEKVSETKNWCFKILIKLINLQQDWQRYKEKRQSTNIRNKTGISLEILHPLKQ